MLKRSWKHGMQPGFVIIWGICDSDKIEIHLMLDCQRGAFAPLYL
jgi:hypothetical protein